MQVCSLEYFWVSIGTFESVSAYHSKGLNLLERFNPSSVHSLAIALPTPPQSFRLSDDLHLILFKFGIHRRNRHFFQLALDNE